MKVPRFVPPTFELSAFNCPGCGAYSRQQWGLLQKTNSLEEQNQQAPWRTEIMDLVGWAAAFCDRCEKVSLWYEATMVYPVTSAAPESHPDMSFGVWEDYEEARAVLGSSPRSAAALLRLAIQLLCIELGQPGKDLNHDIGALVGAGLDVRVQKALDAVRIIGNNAVHPGQLDLRDDRETATKCFALVNFIIDEMISKPQQIEKIWESLPEGAKESTARRDSKPR
jgi:hypothetical protein